jgi:hypothetical protein
MEIIGTIAPLDFDNALRRAEKIGHSLAVPGLAAPLEVGLLGRVDAIWEQIAQALRKARTAGYAGAMEIVERAADEAEKLIAASGRKADEVRQMIVARLQEYLTAIVEAVLAQVQPTIKVGGNLMLLRKVDLARKIALSGSLKVTIASIAEMTGSGEITVTASYGADATA